MNTSRPTIETCVSPELLHYYSTEGKLVVVADILRATSCMTAGLASGVPFIIPVATESECLALKSEGYLTAGERDGKKLEGFDLGNSPFSFINAAKTRTPIGMTTTNGTRAIALSSKADEIVVGSFLNIGSICKYITEQKKNVLIVCSGWKSKFSLEDTLFAGAVMSKTIHSFSTICDATMAAVVLYEKAKHDKFNFIQQASHVQRLSKIDPAIQTDIAYCVTENVFDVVPVMREGKLIAL